MKSSETIKKYAVPSLKSKLFHGNKIKRNQTGYLKLSLGSLELQYHTYCWVDDK